MKDLDITYNPGKANEYKATRGVSMDVYDKEFVAFFGPSGCGKSTIFYCILGILPHSAGQILVKGQNPYSFSPEEMVYFQTRTIGIIYQAFYLIPSISVIDNVSLPQIFQGVAPGKRKEWSKQILRRFGMEEYADKYPDNLSGGQSQRVSVSRSMVNNPDILLADEPTGNLDSVSTKQVMDALDEINYSDKKTVIMITHNAAQLQYCHRVFYLKDGKLERVVPNPEKKQIAKIDKQKILVTEMDQLSKVFPYDTPTVLKVKSIVNYLTQDLNFSQILNLEQYTQLMVEGRIDGREYKKNLLTRFTDGGVGVSAELADVMARKVDRVLKQAEDIRRFRRRFMANNFFNREKALIDKITRYVAEEFEGELHYTQSKRLSELIYKRVAGLISREQFLAGIQIPERDGGAGVDRLSAKRMTLHFEKLLTQAVEAKGHH